MRAWARSVRELVSRERERNLELAADRMYSAALEGDILAMEILLSGAATAGSREARNLRQAAFGLTELESAEALEQRVSSWLQEHRT